MKNHPKYPDNTAPQMMYKIQRNPGDLPIILMLKWTTMACHLQPQGMPSQMMISNLFLNSNNESELYVSNESESESESNVSESVLQIDLKLSVQLSVQYNHGNKSTSISFDSPASWKRRTRFEHHTKPSEHFAHQTF